jgi:thiamine phosphate synthase YjbQ (UPF0047 family)
MLYLVAAIRTGTFSKPMWIQRELTLKPRARGFHLVTDEILGQLPELRGIKIGMMHVFIKHTR